MPKPKLTQSQILNRALGRVTHCADIFTQWSEAIDVMNWLRDNRLLAADVDVEKEAYEYALKYATDNIKQAFKLVFSEPSKTTAR